MSYDGIVSRTVNRRISRPMARAVAKTPATPNAVTMFTLLLSCAVGGGIALGWEIAGGIGIQLVSIIDGVDGDLARIKGMATRFGEVLDAVTDRYADAIMLGGMTIFAVRFEDHSQAVFVGMLALAASLSVSYSRARIEASLGSLTASSTSTDGIFGLASRDVRSLVAAAGTCLGQCWWTLIVLAVLGSLTVAYRLAYLRILHGRQRRLAAEG